MLPGLAGRAFCHVLLLFRPLGRHVSLSDSMSKPLLRPCKRIKELRVLSYPSCSASETVAVPQDLWGAFSETGGHRRCVIEQDRALRGRRPRSLSRWGEGFALPPGLRARRARGRALPWLLHPAGPGCGRQGAASGCRDPAGPSGGGGGAGPGAEARGWR